MFCYQHEYGKIEEGFQYCKKCGKAICVHKWEEVESFEKIDNYTGNVVSIIKLCKCKKCGELTNFSIC